MRNLVAMITPTSQYAENRRYVLGRTDRLGVRFYAGLAYTFERG